MSTTEKHPFRILVVDDEPDLRNILCMSLRLSDYETLDAESGNEALRVLANNKVDLILCDVRMPNGNGLELLEQLRQRSIDVPLIFMTGYAELNQEQAKARGAMALLFKPFAFGEVVSVIEQVLKA